MQGWHTREVGLYNSCAIYMSKLGFKPVTLGEGTQYTKEWGKKIFKCAQYLKIGCK